MKKHYRKGNPNHYRSLWPKEICDVQATLLIGEILEERLPEITLRDVVAIAVLTGLHAHRGTPLAFTIDAESDASLALRCADAYLKARET